MKACVLPAVSLLAMLPLTQFAAVAPTTSAATSPESSTAADYGKLPLGFEVNPGQSDPSVKFLSHGHGYSLPSNE